MEKYTLEYLLKEYERLYILRSKELDRAEERVNLFLTIFSVAFGGILIFSQTKMISMDFQSHVILVALLILQLFGINILNRLNSRSIQLRVTDRLLSEIRKIFEQSSKELEPLNSLRNELYDKKSEFHGIKKHVIKRMRGTLTDLVILCNGIIFAGMISILINWFNATIVVNIIIVVASFFLFNFLQLLYHNKAKSKLPPLE